MHVRTWLPHFLHKQHRNLLVFGEKQSVNVMFTNNVEGKCWKDPLEIAFQIVVINPIWLPLNTVNIRDVLTLRFVLAYSKKKIVMS